MTIDLRSLLKAGGATALTGLVFSVLVALLLGFGFRTAAGPDSVGLILGSLTTFPLLTPVLCAGLAFLPVGAGLGYAALATHAQQPIATIRGGALAGAFGGLVYGLCSGAISLAMQSGSAAFLQDVEPVPVASRTILGVGVSVGVAMLAGLMFGALGSGLWRMWQRRGSTNDPADQNRGAASILWSDGAALALGCGLLIACALLLLTANAAYWTNARRNPDPPLISPSGAASSGAIETSTVGGTNVEELQAKLIALPLGDATRGEIVFARNACHACHSLEAGGDS